MSEISFGATATSKPKVPDSIRVSPTPDHNGLLCYAIIISRSDLSPPTATFRQVTSNSSDRHLHALSPLAATHQTCPCGTGVIMAVRDTISRQAAEEEAEVDVLKSHLETRAQMTKKINGNRAKVEDAGKKLDLTVAALGGETQKLQDMLKSTWDREPRVSG